MQGGRNGGGQTAGKENEAERETKPKRRTDIETDRRNKASVTERKKENMEKKRLGPN